MKDYLEKLGISSFEDGYRLIRQGTALIDGSGFGILKVSGDSAAEELNALVTKDVQFLNIDTISECLVLEEDASVLGLVYICHLDTDFIVLTPLGSEKAAAKISSSLSGSKVEDLSGSQDLVCLEGPTSYKFVRDVLNVSIDMLPLRGIEEKSDWNGYAITVMRIGRAGEYAYAVLGSSEAMAKAVDEICSYGSEKGLAVGVAGEDVMQTCMLETLQPDFSTLPVGEQNLFALGLQWLIQYEKEEYCGHDAMMQLFGGEAASELVFFKAEGRQSVEVGAKISLEGEEIGKVIQESCSPGLGCAFGSALIQKDLAVPGVEFTLTDKDGDCILETIASPVVRPLSWDQPMEG